jgi:type IV secretory pathway VirB3-like protein
MSESVNDPLFQAMTRPPLVWPGIASDWALYSIVVAACGLLLGRSLVWFLVPGVAMVAVGLIIQRVDPHLVQIWDVLLLRCLRPCRVSHRLGFRVYGE